MPAVLVVDELSVTLSGARVVDSVSLQLHPGRLHALVGESGSGKSMTALALTGLTPPGAKVLGRVRLGEVDLLAQTARQMRQLLGRALTLMLQEPMAALNPVLTVETMLTEALQAHRQWSSTEARSRARTLLREVGLLEVDRVLGSYPHQLSGGMRQRVLMAAALAGEPKVLIADEPTTALDASVRGVVLDLLKALATHRQLAVLLLTHDLGAVKRVCDDVSVMYAGRVVEHGELHAVLDQPRHPYTQGLLQALPSNAKRGEPLRPLPGAAPSPAEHIEGCRFRPRCAFSDAACTVRPALERGAACHHPRSGSP